MTQRRDTLIVLAATGATVGGLSIALSGSIVLGAWTLAVGVLTLIRLTLRLRFGELGLSRARAVTAYALIAGMALAGLALIVLAVSGVGREPVFPALFGAIAVVSALAILKLAHEQKK